MDKLLVEFNFSICMFVDFFIYLKMQFNFNNSHNMQIMI